MEFETVIDIIKIGQRVGKKGLKASIKAICLFVGVVLVMISFNNEPRKKKLNRLKTSEQYFIFESLNTKYFIIFD